MITRICPVCGREFKTYPSAPNVTCSAACRSIWTQERHTGGRKQWSEEARQALRERPTPEALRHGTVSAQRLPGGQRGELNREAKVWELVAPNGDIIKTTNLLDWCRQNAHLFGMDATEAPRIRSGFTQIARSMRGLTKSPVRSYKGWGLNALPVVPGIDPTLRQLSFPVFVRLRVAAKKYPATNDGLLLFARDAGCDNSALDVLRLIRDCADGGLSSIRAVSGLNREEFADRYCLPLKSIEGWESRPQGLTPWAERMLAYVVVIDRLQDNWGS